jgi:hypothetical protein
MYWKPAPGHDPWELSGPSGRAIGKTWADELRQGRTLPQLEPIPSREFVNAIRQKFEQIFPGELDDFPEAMEDKGIVALDLPSADLELRWTDQYVEVDARLLWTDTGHAIDELAADFELDWFDFRT